MIIIKLSEKQKLIQEKTNFLKDIPMISADEFTAREMDSIDRDLRFNIFKKIEINFRNSKLYQDLYSYSFPNESKFHEEKLRQTRILVGRNRNLDYSDRIKFKFALLDPTINYPSGIYDNYASLNFNNILNDGRRIIKSVYSGNYKMNHLFNTKTMEKYEIYDSPSNVFLYRLCYYPNKKAWIEIESKE